VKVHIRITEKQNCIHGDVKNAMYHFRLINISRSIKSNHIQINIGSISLNDIIPLYCMINCVGEEKELRSLRSIEPVTNERDKNKTCVNCGNISTQIAVFDVDGATIIERYCDNCVKSIKSER
jgi:hypothetical protein